MKKVILLVTLFYGYKKVKDLARKQKSFNEFKIDPSLYTEMFKDISLISRLTS